MITREAGLVAASSFHALTTAVAEGVVIHDWIVGPSVCGIVCVARGDAVALVPSPCNTNSGAMSLCNEKLYKSA